MSNTCDNVLVIKGENSAQAKVPIEEALEGFPLKSSVDWHSTTDGYQAFFDTHWNPPIKQVHDLQHQHPELEIELHWLDTQDSLRGTVLSNGNENVEYAE